MLSRARVGSHLSALESLAIVLGVAAALVLLRALVYLLFEQVGFDSDQAIIGLMAKHLGEGRAFPLFLYGQTYMLAVEAWTAVPFFLIVVTSPLTASRLVTASCAFTLAGTFSLDTIEEMAEAAVPAGILSDTT